MHVVESGLASGIRALRLARGMGQGELARRAGLSQAQISRIENGTIHATERTLHAIARALDAHLMLIPYERAAEVVKLSGISSAEATDPGDVFDDVFIPDDER